MDERKAGVAAKMQGADVAKVEEPKYLGSPSKEMDSAQERWKKMIVERDETKLEISTSEGQLRLSILRQSWKGEVQMVWKSAEEG